MPRNRYLMDRAMRRGMRDGRNPYGSRGGYVTSRRGRDRADYDMASGSRGYDRAMDSEYDYAKYSGGYDSRYGSQRGGQDGHYPYERYGEPHRPMDFEMYGYGVGGIRPMDYAQGDYARGGRGRGRDRDYAMDYGYDYGYDYASEDMEKEWKEDLKKWCEELKKYDKFKLPKEQILQMAKQMGVQFNEFNEEEFLCTYYMILSDDEEEKTIANPQMAIKEAKKFLMDKDSKLKGSEKLCAYYYEIINAGEE